MDGINPTLAFAALFLGLSGHPREATPDLNQQAAISVPADFACATMAISADVPPAIPAGGPLTFGSLDEEQDPSFDVGWTEPVSAATDEGLSANETGCDTTASQP